MRKDLETSQTESLPKQERSRRTRESILAAAEGIFAERGWDSLTTNAVAEAAGISIGSLYRYFPDKLAILRALAERSLRPTLALMDELAQGSGRLDLRAVLPRFLAPREGGSSRGELCLRRLQGSGGSEELGRLARELELAVEGSLAQVVVRLLPGIAEKEARLKATVLRILVGGFAAEMEASPAQREALGTELARILESWLGTGH